MSTDKFTRSFTHGFTRSLVGIGWDGGEPTPPPASANIITENSNQIITENGNILITEGV